MVFPSDVNAQVSQSSAQFDVVTHPIKIIPVPDEAWVEDAPATFPQQDWVDLSDGKRGFCVISQGLPEYEVLDTERREVAITLLRAVGFLGAGTEMQTAEIGGGPNIATPGAQIQRKLTFSLSILPHKGTWDQAEVWRQALAFKNPPKSYTTLMDNIERTRAHGAGQSSRSFMSVEGKNIVLSSMKKAENGESLILRFYNPSDTQALGVAHLSFVPVNVQSAGLDELPQMHDDNVAPFIFAGSRDIQLSIPPKKIITLRIER
jgi:alpha-mannosidase